MIKRFKDIVINESSRLDLDVITDYFQEYLDVLNNEKIQVIYRPNTMIIKISSDGYKILSNPNEFFNLSKSIALLSDCLKRFISVENDLEMVGISINDQYKEISICLSSNNKETNSLNLNQIYEIVSKTNRIKKDEDIIGIDLSTMTPLTIGNCIDVEKDKVTFSDNTDFTINTNRLLILVESIKSKMSKEYFSRHLETEFGDGAELELMLTNKIIIENDNVDYEVIDIDTLDKLYNDINFINGEEENIYKNKSRVLVFILKKISK